MEFRAVRTQHAINVVDDETMFVLILFGCLQVVGDLPVFLRIRGSARRSCKRVADDAAPIPPDQKFRADTDELLVTGKG